MFERYDKRDLNLIECILFNTIMGIILWLMTGFISTIQDKIVKSFNYNGLDILLYLCPLFIFYWFIQVISYKVKYNLSNKYCKLIPVTTIILTTIVLIYFFGFFSLYL